MVYYLKYRPQSLTDLIGQESIVETLKKSLDNDKLSHAYLFVGPRGVGKTSTARILAKMVNCENQKGEVPCNKCVACTSIGDGSSLDLIEVDAASNRGIDDVRELRDKIKLSPTSLKKKVYIIDEVHMLTTEAFNALLKTLEEPPAHALFILATTDVQKIPATILSRVTRLDFNSAAPEGLSTVFKNIAQKEGLQIDEDALSLLVKKSDGSFRDGEKILDQLSAIDKHVTVKLIEEHLNGAGFDAVSDLANLISAQDPKQLILKANVLISAGISPKDLIYSLMDFTRAMILVKLGVADALKKDFSSIQLNQIEELAKNFTNEKLLTILNSLQKGYEGLKFAAIQTLPLEIALIESCGVVQLVNKVVVTEQVEITVVPQPKEELEEVLAAPAEESARDDKGEISSGQDIASLKDKWSYILEMVRSYNFSLEALLKQVKIGLVEAGQVELKVPYAFHQRIVETPRNRDLLESVLSDVLGRPTRVHTTLESRPVRIEELANVEVAADDEVIRVAAEIFNS